MKRRIRILSCVMIVLLTAILFSACGDQGSDTVNGLPADVSQPTADNTLPTDDAAVWPGGFSDDSEEVVSGIDWSSVYLHAILDNNYQLNVNDEWGTTRTISDDTQLALHDFDQNGVPELIVGVIGARGMGMDVFTIIDGEVVYTGGSGAGTAFSCDNPIYPGLFVSYNGSYPTEYVPLGYLELKGEKLDVRTVITYGPYDETTKDRITTVNDAGLYAAYNESKQNLLYYYWREIRSNGWNSFTKYYGYDVALHYGDHTSFTLGGAEVSLELPADWAAEVYPDGNQEYISFYQKDIYEDSRSGYLCSLRCMTAVEYESMQEGVNSYLYYGRIGKYHYAMVWSSGYGMYPDEKGELFTKALSISREVAHTFRSVPEAIK